MNDFRNLPAPVLDRIADVDPSFLTARHTGFDINYRGRTLEHRAFQRIEVRSAEDGAPIIDGYATVYEFPYEVAGGPPWGWTETIAEGAASRSVSLQDDVYLFFDHDGLSLASTKDGSLVLSSDKIGLRSTGTIDAASPYSMEIVRRVQSGALDAMSFAFQVLKQEWNDDYTERRILECKLYDTSVVSYPANPATVVGVRSETPVAAPRVSLAYASAVADSLR